MTCVEKLLIVTPLNYLVPRCRVQVRHPSDKRAKKFLVCTGNCHLTQGFLAAVGLSRSPALQRVDRYIGAQGLREIHIVDSAPVKARHQEQWSHAGLAGRKLEQRRRPAHPRGGTQQL